MLILIARNVRADIFRLERILGAVMIYKSVTIVGVLTLVSAVAHAGSAPKDLYGKSIAASWFESRAQNDRTGALQNPQISIYVSSAGRTFARVFVVLGRPRGEFAFFGGYGIEEGLRALFGGLAKCKHRERKLVARNSRAIL